MVKLGKKLENPYSVENMQKAWSNLKTSNTSGRISGNEIEIITSHRYIKFIPKNEADLAIIKRDSSLVLYEYPLDYEIVEQGGFYRDPGVPSNQPTYRYCAITIDKKLPVGIEFEVLANLFIPDENKDGNPGGRLVSSELIRELVDEALRITNNLQEKVTSNGRVQASSWRPA